MYRILLNKKAGVTFVLLIRLDLKETIKNAYQNKIYETSTTP